MILSPAEKIKARSDSCWTCDDAKIYKFQALVTKFYQGDDGMLFSFHKDAVHKNGWRLRGVSWSDCYIHVKSHKKEILGEVIPNCPLCLTPTNPSDLSRQPVPCAKDIIKLLNHFNKQEINPKSSINHKGPEICSQISLRIVTIALCRNQKRRSRNSPIQWSLLHIPETSMFSCLQWAEYTRERSTHHLLGLCWVSPIRETFHQCPHIMVVNG